MFNFHGQSVSPCQKASGLLPICADPVVWSLQDSGGDLALGRLFKQTGDTLLGFGHPKSKNNSSSCASRLAEDFMHKFSSSLWKRITLKCQSHIGVWERVTFELNSFKNNWEKNHFFAISLFKHWRSESTQRGEAGEKEADLSNTSCDGSEASRMSRFRVVSCFESCEFQLSYNTRLRRTEEEFLQLSKP